MVQRYGDFSEGVGPDEEGEYVKYEDYAALEEELAKKTELLDRLAKAFAALSDLK